MYAGRNIAYFTELKQKSIAYRRSTASGKETWRFLSWKNYMTILYAFLLYLTSS